MKVDSIQSFINCKALWPINPASPDCNPLDYHFWDKVKVKVYEGRFNQPFENEEQLKRRIRRVWNEMATDVVEIRKALKQFVPRLRQVAEKEGNCIKMTFKWTLILRILFWTVSFLIDWCYPDCRWTISISFVKLIFHARSKFVFLMSIFHHFPAIKNLYYYQKYLPFPWFCFFRPEFLFESPNMSTL